MNSHYTHWVNAPSPPVYARAELLVDVLLSAELSPVHKKELLVLVGTILLGIQIVVDLGEHRLRLLGTLMKSGFYPIPLERC